MKAVSRAPIVPIDQALLSLLRRVPKTARFCPIHEALFLKQSSLDPCETNHSRGMRMLIGYAIASTLEQKAGLDAQHAELKAAGCKRLHSEQISSVAARPKLDQA